MRSPEEILSDVERMYGQCRTYQDRGCVYTRFLNHDGTLSHDSVQPFTTAFVRPNRFRYEFTDSGCGSGQCRYLIAANGSQVKSWWDVTPGVEHPESLGLALAGATGVSGGSAHTVPALLMPDEVSGRRLLAGAVHMRLEDGDLDGRACYRVTRHWIETAEQRRERQEHQLRAIGWAAPESESDPEVYWIERDTLLILRIDGRTRFPDFSTESVTTYEAEVDGFVPEDHLVFDPPDTAEGA
jgi:hypothetical protein